MKSKLPEKSIYNKRPFQSLCLYGNFHISSSIASIFCNEIYPSRCTSVNPFITARNPQKSFTFWAAQLLIGGKIGPSQDWNTGKILRILIFGFWGTATNASNCSNSSGWSLKSHQNHVSQFLNTSATWFAIGPFINVLNLSTFSADLSWGLGTCNQWTRKSNSSSGEATVLKLAKNGIMSGLGDVLDTRSI